MTHKNCGQLVGYSFFLTLCFRCDFRNTNTNLEMQSYCSKSKGSSCYTHLPLLCNTTASFGKLPKTINKHKFSASIFPNDDLTCKFIFLKLKQFHCDFVLEGKPKRSPFVNMNLSESGHYNTDNHDLSLALRRIVYKHVINNRPLCNMSHQQIFSIFSICLFNLCVW